MRKMVLLVLLAVVSCLYACSNIDGFRDMTANEGGGGGILIIPQLLLVKMLLQKQV